MRHQINAMENTLTILNTILRGFTDSIKGTVVIFTLDKKIKEQALRNAQLKEKSPGRRRDLPDGTKPPTKRQEEPKVLTRTLQCCVLNGGVFWLSLLLFDNVFLPCLRWLLEWILTSDGESLVWAWTSSLLTWLFAAIWVLPLLLLSKVVNSLWFQDIADSAYRYSSGRPQVAARVSKVIADNLFSVLVQTLFLAQAFAVSLLPLGLLAQFGCQLHMCMLYSLYSLEYKWYNMGWELQKRLTYIENNWPYFVGFGLPLAVLTALPSSFIVSGCVFSILFPLFIISGHEASPVTGSCSFPLPLFTPVIVVCNTVFNQAIGSR